MTSMDMGMDRAADLQHAQPPRIPALLFPRGVELSRRQESGERLVFRVVRSIVRFRNVYSEAEKSYSEWYTVQKQWVPVDALISGQLEIERSNG